VLREDAYSAGQRQRPLSLVVGIKLTETGLQGVLTDLSSTVITRQPPVG